MRVPLADAEIEFDDLGSGAPILLLHGFPATRQLWKDVAPRLVEGGFRVIVPDLLGYGASSMREGARADMASQACWLWALLDRLQIERTVIVAHDVGSAAAQLMVNASPDRVRGLIVLDGVYAGEWAMDAIESIRAWAHADAHRLAPVLARRLGKSASMREMLAAYEGQAGGLRLIRAARDLDPKQTMKISEGLRASGVRALVLWGRDDRYLAVDTVARPLAELLNAPLVLLPGGHFTPLDCPHEVSAQVLDFVARLP
ncbi:MAG TPA: alpha/beta hydrolase [Steroidobacteraceae bacterium]|nr:alpha/beta hydrolase [Steroidobacteraceae bacterium]